jgi:hypothetical protein
MLVDAPPRYLNPHRKCPLSFSRFRPFAFSRSVFTPFHRETAKERKHERNKQSQTTRPSPCFSAFALSPFRDLYFPSTQQKSSLAASYFAVFPPISRPLAFAGSDYTMGFPIWNFSTRRCQGRNRFAARRGSRIWAVKGELFRGIRQVSVHQRIRQHGPP